MHWAAWPWGKENCGTVANQVYEGGSDVKKELSTRPHWSWFQIRTLYQTKRTRERDLVGFIGGEEEFNFFIFVLGIPCISLLPYGCHPFEPLASLNVPEGTLDYHNLLLDDLMQRLQKTLTMLKLASVTNDMSKMEIEQNCK